MRMKTFINAYRRRRFIEATKLNRQARQKRAFSL